MPPAVARKLERYRRRWEKMQPDRLKPPTGNGRPPGKLEFVCHNAAGRALTIYDSLVRAGFEFLPLTWLRAYRLFKNWVVNPPSGALDEKISLFKDLKRHWLTILTAGLLTAAIAFIHYHSNPHLLFILFYGIPCALLALVVNLRWATLLVLVVSLISPTIQYDGDPDYQSSFVFFWNFFTRFVLLEIFILTLGRIRMEFSKTGFHVK